MTQTFEMIVCRWCSQNTPKIGSYCMQCGKNPKPLRSMLWPGTKLKVADGADLHPLIEAVFGKKAEKVPSVEVVRWGLSRLSEKQEQILIRIYGLDGGGVRGVRTICEESKKSDTAIYNNHNRALRRLRCPSVALVLIGYAPIPVID